MVQRSSLKQEAQAACMVLVNDRVSATHGGMLKTNAGGQNVMHMHIFYTWSEWQNIYAKDVSQTHKLLIMAERCRRLGIARPSERSVAAIVAILYGDAAGIGRAGPGALLAVREFKTILHRDDGGYQSHAVGVSRVPPPPATPRGLVHGQLRRLSLIHI